MPEIKKIKRIERIIKANRLYKYLLDDHPYTIDGQPMLYFTRRNYVYWFKNLPSPREEILGFLILPEEKEFHIFEPKEKVIEYMLSNMHIFD